MVTENPGAAAPLANYQNQIYVGGLQGTLPSLPVSADELERRAQAVMTQGAFGYVAGGAGSEDTMRANRDAFRRHRIVPRMLRDVATRDLSTDVLRTEMPARYSLLRSASNRSRTPKVRSPWRARPHRWACRWCSALLHRSRSKR